MAEAQQKTAKAGVVFGTAAYGLHLHVEVASQAQRAGQSFYIPRGGLKLARPEAAPEKRQRLAQAPRPHPHIMDRLYVFAVPGPENAVFMLQDAVKKLRDDARAESAVFAQMS
ncbi:hypothetical protein FACS1894187_14190 [Synergistales bacterium]|nr:hypothetical protein FACS1894187_14190 [Synergistales bacterium]